MLIFEKDFKYLLSRRVSKDNRLINGKAPLTGLQYQIFSACLSTLPFNPMIFKDEAITINQILGKEKLTPSDYRNVKEASLGLTEASVKIYNGREWVGIPLFRYIGGVEGSAIIRFQLNDKLEPFVLNLKGNFTTHKYGYITLLRQNMYAIRLYELLYERLYQGKREFSIKELRELLVLEDKYPNNAELKRNVIEPAVKLINKADLIVSVDYIKKGRSITGIEFSIAPRYALPPKEE